MKNNEREKYEEFVKMYDSYKEKAILIAKTKYKWYNTYDPDVVLEYDIFKVDFEYYVCGSWESESVYVNEEELFKDLDIIKEEYDKAKIESYKKAKLEEIRKEEKIKKEKLEKEKATYLLLKNKFES